MPIILMLLGRCDIVASPRWVASPNLAASRELPSHSTSLDFTLSAEG